MPRAEGRGTSRRKRCRFCRELFRPDPRLGSRQIACSAAECQKARKKQSQASWVARHPGYFEGRYANTRAWLDERPGYLAAWRERNPERVARDNERRRERRRIAAETAADIQDAISLQGTVSKALGPFLATARSAAIQDPIWPQVITASLFGARYMQRRDTRLDRHSPAQAVASASVGTALFGERPG